jgi:hypothetical protein
MPRGPKGEKRPADVIGAAVGRIATGEIDESTPPDDGKDDSGIEPPTFLYPKPAPAG